MTQATTHIKPSFKELFHKTRTKKTSEMSFQLNYLSQAQLCPNNSSHHTPPKPALTKPTSPLNKDSPFAKKSFICLMRPSPPQPKAPLYFIAITYFMAFNTMFHPFSFRATEITVLPTGSEYTKPRARIFASGALHVPNYMPTIDQSTVTSFHKRIP